MVLNTNTQRETGRKAQLQNIAAGKAVADIIRTTLGPKSMLKMLLDPMGGIVLTNDGAWGGGGVGRGRRVGERGGGGVGGCR